MIYDIICKRCGHKDEIEKPMQARFPHCVNCGGETRRTFENVPIVQYMTHGFYSTDYARMEGMIGKDKAERLRKKNQDAERRAREGRLTEYEKVLETV